MSRKKFDLAGIKFNEDKHTSVAAKDLNRWVIWQYPIPVKGGFIGAVCPPLTDSGWIPAVINPGTNRVHIFAHNPNSYSSPEEAVEYFSKNKPG